MRAVVTFAAAAVCAGAVAACSGPERTTDRIPALGTLVEITLIETEAARRHRALRDAREALTDASRDWYAWGDGELARVNATGAAPSAELAALIQRADALAVRSEHLFEPGIGALVEAWGFHRGERADGPPPSAAAIAAARDAPRVTDLGAIAKGAAVARVVTTLRRAGVRAALVDAGGDLAAIGDAGGRPWRIGVRDPRGNGVIVGLDLADGESVFTSGDYERAFVWNGVRYHHLLDPRTGEPARETASLTVLHRDPTAADAAATALFVAGDDWRRIAARLGVAFVLRVTPDGRLEATRAMAARLGPGFDGALEVIDVAAPAR